MKRVALVHSKEDTPETADRAEMVMALMTSLELLPHFVSVEAAPRASAEELCKYHSRDYVEALRILDRAEEEEETELDEHEAERYGLAFDAAVFNGVWAHATTVAGGSLRAAELLASRKADVAVHWQGGRHHATSDRAAGFCYVNDVVLAALRLLASHRAVIVLDLDIHHGDGTEDAFRHSPSLLNVSFHLRAPGFYPGTGALSDCGSGRGTNATVNVPLRRGLNSATFARVFAEVAGLCRRWAGDRSCAVIVLCGTDGLRGDPRGGWNLQPSDLADAVGCVLDWHLPTLLLGGGGYVPANAARAWALCTMRALGLVAADNAQIPPDTAFFERYRDGSFFLHSSGKQSSSESGHAADENSTEYIEAVLATLRARFDVLAAPPPAIQPTPKLSSFCLVGAKRGRQPPQPAH